MRINNKQITEHPLKGWIPYKLVIENNVPMVHWLYVDDKIFDEPFFEETIMFCKKFNSRLLQYKSVSSVDSVIDWANTLPDIVSVNFIFHISRCGSTLLSQLIGLSKKYLVLAEVPLFDEILRLPYKLKNIDNNYVEFFLEAAIKFLGQKKTGIEEQIFIKTDSWHICFYKTYRQLYPNAPCVLLYRSPDEVVYSHQKVRGMQAVPYVIEPAVFGFIDREIKEANLDVYTAMVLEKYICLFEEAAVFDEQALLLDYKMGINTMMQQIANYLKTQWDEKHIVAMQTRSKFHSKRPTQNFEKELRPNIEPVYLQHVMRLYGKLDKTREKAR